MTKKFGLILSIIILIFPLLINTAFGQDRHLTIILVRHAEKAIGNSTDPPLTDEGKIRAAELAAILKYVPLDAVFTTPYIRTKETILPSAEKKGIKLEYYNAGREKELLMLIFDRYRGKQGCVLIAGHSNTIHLFLNFLVGEDRFALIEDDIYDNIFFITASDPGDGTVLHLRYGKHISHVWTSPAPFFSSLQKNSHLFAAAIDTLVRLVARLNFIIEYGIA